MPLGREAPDLSLPMTFPAYRLWWEVSVCFDHSSSPRMKAGTALRKKPARRCPYTQLSSYRFQLPPAVMMPVPGGMEICGQTTPRS